MLMIAAGYKDGSNANSFRGGSMFNSSPPKY
jgi:hypothetical protein